MSDSAGSTAGQRKFKGLGQFNINSWEHKRDFEHE
jgi:hypothetical protein